MIKAIIFDCFGVLTAESWLPFKAQHFSDKPELLEKVNDLHNQANLGRISRQEALGSIGELAGMTLAEVNRAVSGNMPNEELFAYINQLKPDYKIGFLSNVAADILDRIFTPDHLAAFDVMCLSFEEGYIKPQPEAFEITAKRLGLAVNECVLIDDQQKNVDGAQAVGMAAILYRDVPQLRRELGQILQA